MANLKLNSTVVYNTGTTKVTTPSLKLTNGSTTLYCPLLTNSDNATKLIQTTKVVTKLPLKIKKDTTTYQLTFLEETLDTKATLTFYYKAGYNGQTRGGTKQERYSYSCGTYNSQTCYDWRNVSCTDYRRQTVAYVKATTLKNTNTKCSLVIVSATCNGVNVLNTYGATRSSWTGWQHDSYPAYPSFTENAPIVIKYRVQINGITIKENTVKVSISVPINTSTERRSTPSVNI